MKDKLGICQWFHFQDYETVERAVHLLRELGVRHFRTGISWADYHQPEGKQWYQWLFRQLSEFQILLSIWHTPPSIAEGGVCAGPPIRLLDFADFIWQVEREFGDHYETLELWNEPNNKYKWNFIEFDPQWEKFAGMIASAAAQAKSDGRRTVLGGMMPVDHGWLERMQSYGALEHIDVIAIHAFPEMWWTNHPCWDQARQWNGWQQKVSYIAQYTGSRPVWISETGLATWNLDSHVEARLDMQSQLLVEASQAPVPRVYWYSLIDLDPHRDAIEGFHVDENEYHLGLVTWDGIYKPAFHTMRSLLQPTKVPLVAVVP
jgi:CDP-paratose 2-epimerase